MWRYKKAKWIGRILLEESAIPGYILFLSTEIRPNLRNITCWPKDVGILCGGYHAFENFNVVNEDSGGQ